MAKIARKIRARFFFAVEGESEQSFVKWLQGLADQQGLYVHLDIRPLGGGGYSSMLKQAGIFRERGLSNGRYKSSFLLVDEDRANSGDWSVEVLRQKASSQNINVCLQRPNLEGLLLRMILGKERSAPDASGVMPQLVSAWPGYRKPMNARDLEQKYSFNDVARVANLEPDLLAMLKKIGLIQ
ncbi:MAG: hypothetical protein ABL951_11860 [Alphaproteobacteria bacterium]